MGCFGNLFKKKEPREKTPAVVSERSRSMTIDIRDDCFVIDGNKFEIPMHVDALSAILGKPRAVKFNTTPEMRAFLEEMEGAPVTNRVNYAWDDLGLMCYTLNGKVVNTFGIHFNPQKHDSPADPKMLYGGEITINGEDWFPTVMSGEKFDSYRRIIVGNLVINAGYTDYYQDDATRDRKSFCNFEIRLKNSDD